MGSSTAAADSSSFCQGQASLPQHLCRDAPVMNGWRVGDCREVALITCIVCNDHLTLLPQSAFTIHLPRITAVNPHERHYFRPLPIRPGPRDLYTVELMSPILLSRPSCRLVPSRVLCLNRDECPQLPLSRSDPYLGRIKGLESTRMFQCSSQ